MDFKTIIEGKEGVWKPLKGEDILSLQDLFKDAKTEPKDRYSHNKDAEAVLESVMGLRELDDDAKRALALYSGTSNLDDFYGKETDNTAFSFPSWVYSGVYKICEELGVIKNSLLVHNAQVGRIIGVMPDNFKNAIKTKEISLSIVNEVENTATKICRLLYPYIEYYFQDENIIINNLNKGITGYAAVVGKKHQCIISQQPEEADWPALIETVEDGGWIIAMTEPWLTEGHDMENTRKQISEKLDMIGIMRMPPFSLMEKTGHDFGFDVIVFRKRTKTDELFATRLLNMPAAYSYVLISLPEEQGNTTLDQRCNSNEMYKTFATMAEQAERPEWELAMYLKRILLRKANNQHWTGTVEQSVPYSGLYSKKGMDYLIQIFNLQLDDLRLKNGSFDSDCASIEQFTNTVSAANASALSRLEGFLQRHAEDTGLPTKKAVMDKIVFNLLLQRVDGKAKRDPLHASTLASLLTVKKDTLRQDQCNFYIPFLKNRWFTNHGLHGANDVYHSKQVGFYYVPIHKIDFLTEAKELNKYLMDYEKPPEIIRLGDTIFLPKDNVSPGSVILHRGMVLKKMGMDAHILVDIALNNAAQNFGMDVANRANTFSHKYTLLSVYSEAKNLETRTEDFLADLESQLFGIARFSLKEREDKEVNAMTKILVDTFYLGSMVRYEDITTAAKADKDYEKLIERITFINRLISIRNRINNNWETDDNKKELSYEIKEFLLTRRIKKMCDDTVIKKYFQNEGDENKSDDRWFILKAIDKAYAKGIGIFDATPPYDEYHCCFTAIEYIEECRKKADYRVRVDVKKLLSQGERYNATGIYPTSAIAFKDRGAFIREVTSSGEWIVDVDTIFYGEFLIRKDRFVFGNIGKKLNRLKEFETYCNSKNIDTELINLDLITSELQNKILLIPRIPEPIIDLDPHMHIMGFRDQLFPFMLSVFGVNNIKEADFKTDKTENEGIGRWKYIGKVADAEIPGYTLKSVPVSRAMVKRWFNMDQEEKAKRDDRGRVIETKKNGKAQMQNDVETTAERDRYLRRRFNEFIREKTPVDVRDDLYKRYNESYQIYVAPTSDAPLDMTGISETFHGKPFKMNSFQNRFVRRFLQNNRLYANHVVGGGKTINALVSAWIAKRMGIINKPMIVVLLKNLSQWEQHIKELFPKCNYLIVTSENKRRTLAEIAVSDYDFILIPNSTFGDAMDISASLRAEFASDDLSRYFGVKEYLEIEYAKGWENKTIIKSQLKTITKYINGELKQIRDLIDKSKNDFIEMSFDKLGVDALFVDESDVYKNVDTGMEGYLTKVKGIRRSSSGIAQTMRLVSRFIQAQHNNCNRIDMTGTPVSNSATEIYQTMNSITPDLLVDAGILTFNDFIAAHGRVEPMEIVNTQNQIETKPTFVGMRNVNQVKRLINACFDILDQETMNSVKRAQGDPIPIPEFNNMVYPSTPEKILMNHYSQYQVWVLKQIASQDIIVKAARTARKNKVKTEIKQLSSAIGVKDKFGDPLAEMPQMTEDLLSLDQERRLLSFNGGVLYNQIRSGIVHTKLYNEFIDDSGREHSKLNKVVQNAINSFLYSDYESIRQIEGVDFFIKGEEKRIVNNGQLFFMDRMSRTDIEGFNARDEYINKIKNAIPEEMIFPYGKDKLFAVIDQYSSERMDLKKVKKTLQEYFLGFDKNYERGVKYFEQFSGLDESDMDAPFEMKVQGEIKRSIKNITLRDIIQYLYNEGFIRFVFGSTDSMGIGLNLQRTTTDEHHIDMPFRPRDWWQRIGRGLRQGNLNTRMAIHSYSSEGGSETVMLQLLWIKENFLRQIFDLRGLDDFTAEASISGLNTGDVEEQSIFLNQLDGMIHETNDKRIQAFVDQRKELDSLINTEKMYSAIIRNDETNIVRLVKQKESIARNTELYMWLRFEIIPLIEKKEAEQELMDQEHKEVKKLIKESEEYQTAMKAVSNKYGEMLKYVKDDRARNQVVYSQEQDLATIITKFMPEKKVVEDFDLDNKYMMCTKFPSQTSFNREVGEIFFNCYTTLGDSARSQISYFEYKKVEERTVHSSEIKRLSDVEGYTWKRGEIYYLGQLSRALRSKATGINRVMDSEIMACEQFEATINDKDYLATIKKAKEAMSPDNGGGIAQLITAKWEQVRDNQDAYFDFIGKQEEIARYAGYTVENMKEVKTIEERMIMVDNFVDTKKAYESGELSELPTPSSFVDEKLLLEV